MDKEEFINDYENIVNVIDNLLSDIYTKELADYWRDHLMEFKCEYSTAVDEYEADLTEEEAREQRELEQDYWATRF